MGCAGASTNNAHLNTPLDVDIKEMIELRIPTELHHAHLSFA